MSLDAPVNHTFKINTKSPAKLRRPAKNSSEQNEDVKQTLQTGRSGNLIASRLRAGRVGDRYEREADRVADGFVRVRADVNPDTPAAQQEASSSVTRPGSSRTQLNIQRLCTQCEEDVQLKVDEERDDSERAEECLLGFSCDFAAIRQGGEQLAGRGSFEQHLGRDFSGVRIHTDRRANRLAHGLGARAFTFGNHIVFAEGQYQPTSMPGQHLLAHELTHVVQQGRARALQSDAAQAAPVKPATGPVPDVQARLLNDAIGLWDSGPTSEEPLSRPYIGPTAVPFEEPDAGVTAALSEETNAGLPAGSATPDSGTLRRAERKAERRGGRQAAIIRAALDVAQTSNVAPLTDIDIYVDEPGRTQSVSKTPPSDAYTDVPAAELARIRSPDATASVGIGFRFNVAPAPEAPDTLDIYGTASVTYRVKVPDFIGDQPERVSVAKGVFARGREGATTFKVPEPMVLEHEQGHVAIAGRAARVVESFAGRAFLHSQLNGRQQRRLEKLLGNIALDVEYRVTGFFHEETIPKRPTDIQRAAKRTTELLHNSELEKAVRRALVDVVRERSRVLGRFVK